MKVGLDNFGKLFFNGTELRRWDEEVYTLAPDIDTLESIQLNQGVNSLVFKITNRRYVWGLFVHLTDKDGQPLEGIQVSVDPVL